MKTAGLKKKPVIAVLVKRTVLFFFFLSVLTVFLYAIGTAQEFMDRTQLLLLHLSVVLGLCLAMDSFFGVILNIWFFIKERKFRFFGGSGIYFITGTLGAAMAIGAAFIIVASGGNGT
jgi:hypothetical protein